MERQQLSWAQRGRLWLRLSIRVVALVVIGMLLWKLGGRVLSLFMPFILAWLSAAALNPVVRQLQKRLGWSRKCSSFVVLIVFVGGIVTVLFFLMRAVTQEVMGLVADWGSLLGSVKELAQQAEQTIQGWLEKLPGNLVSQDQSIFDRVIRWLIQWMETATPNLGNITNFAANQAKAVTEFVLALVVFLMGFYFMSSDLPYLRTNLTRRMNDRTTEWLRQVKRVSLAAFGGYLKAQLLLSIGVFFILLIGFLIIKQDYALLLALGFSVLDFIPLIGSGTIMVPWAIVDLFLGQYSHAIGLMVIWGIIVVFRRFSEPKVVGDQTGLSPILSLISIYIGMRLYGVLGMILGPILLLVVLNLAQLGLFDGVRNDLRLALEDTMAILRGSREKDL